MVQTTDTGQINWSTVTRVTTNATENINGYEIYKFSDSLQSSKPIFFKIEYGQENAGWGNAPTNVAARPVIMVTVGTGSSGAGAITGQILSRTRLTGVPSPANSVGSGGSGQPTAPVQCYFSGDGSYIAMALGAMTTIPTWQVQASTQYPAGFPAYFVIDRIRDTAGATTNHGVFVLAVVWIPTGTNDNTAATAPGVAFIMDSFTGAGIGATDSYVPISFPGNGFSSSSIGGTIYFWPLPLASAVPEPQALALLGVYKNDILVGTTVPITVLGSSHTYIALTGQRCAPSSFMTSGGLMMRYE